MKFEIPPNSLFATLLRSPWWLSAGIGAAIIVAAAAALPKDYQLAGIFAALPWLIIAAVAAWKQLRVPSAARVEATLEAVRSMSWPVFSKAIEDAFRRDGYGVSPLNGSEADFEVTKAGRTALVGCKRWKVARTGVEPLRELQAAKDAREAHECIYVATGEITDTARKFAEDKNVRLLYGVALVQMLPRGGLGK